MSTEQEALGQAGYVEPAEDAPVQTEATTSHHESRVGDAGHPVGDVAISGASLTESSNSSPSGTTPRYFRDHTNPYTMQMPDWWGSNRRT